MKDNAGLLFYLLGTGIILLLTGLTPIYQVQDNQQRKVNEQVFNIFMPKDIPGISHEQLEELKVRELAVEDDGTNVYFWYRNERDNTIYGVKLSSAL